MRDLFLYCFSFRVQSANDKSTPYIQIVTNVCDDFYNLSKQQTDERRLRC